MPPKATKLKLKKKHDHTHHHHDPNAAASASAAKDGDNSSNVKPLSVTLMSGFLGSGKTSLLKNVLSSRDHNLRCAVIVNEISELNIDAFAMGGTTGVMQVSDKMVEMANGCICCTLREDLLMQLRELAESGKYDCVLIESSGISEPMQVSETFFVELDDDYGPLQKRARLDNCVTVVDSSALRLHLETDEDMKVVDPRAEGEEAEQHIAALLLDQLEFANVILLNKIDNVLPGGSEKEREAEVDALKRIIKSINPSAKIITTTHCKVDVKEILDTSNFSEAYANGKNNWMEDIKSGVKHVPETLEYGVSSFLFKDKMAFHPQRFHDWITKYFLLEELHVGGDDDEEMQRKIVYEPIKKMPINGSAPAPAADDNEDEKATGSSSRKAEKKDEEEKEPEKSIEEMREIAKVRRAARIERYGDLYRSKGFVFLGNPRRLSFYGTVSHSGNTFTFGVGAQWDEFPVASSMETCEQEAGQQLVFIGQNLKHEQLAADLKECLLTKKEEKQLIAQAIKDPWGPDCFPDPFPVFEIPEEDLEDDDEEEEEWEDCDDDDDDDE